MEMLPCKEVTEVEEEVVVRVMLAMELLMILQAEMVIGLMEQEGVVVVLKEMVEGRIMER